MGVSTARTEREILDCFPVMSQLRPHLRREEFVARIRLQQSEGFRLALVRDGDDVVAVAGFRIGHNLAWGKYLYVDDLVTDEAARSAGKGRELLDWLVRTASAEGCDELHLDSGVQRYAAHRFYLRERMEITSHHFRRRLRG